MSAGNGPTDRRRRSRLAATGRVQAAAGTMATARCYGQRLPAHVPPTAIGVAGAPRQATEPIVDDAVAVPRTTGATEGSTTALALSALALSTLGQPVAPLGKLLADHHAQAVSFGNVTALGMAAYALDCGSPSNSRAPSTFAGRRGHDPTGRPLQPPDFPGGIGRCRAQRRRMPPSARIGRPNSRVPAESPVVALSAPSLRRRLRGADRRGLARIAARRAWQACAAQTEPGRVSNRAR